MNLCPTQQNRQSRLLSDDSAWKKAQKDRNKKVTGRAAWLACTQPQPRSATQHGMLAPHTSPPRKYSSDPVTLSTSCTVPRKVQVFYSPKMDLESKPHAHERPGTECVILPHQTEHQPAPHVRLCSLRSPRSRKHDGRATDHARALHAAPKRMQLLLPNKQGRPTSNLGTLQQRQGNIVSNISKLLGAVCPQNGSVVESGCSHAGSMQD
jgi:hypothetical protein